MSTTPDKPTFAEEYAPRPDASQLAAARKRVREESDEAPESPPAAQYLPFIVGAVVVAALVLGSIGLSQQPRALAITPIPAPSMGSTSVLVQGLPAKPTRTSAPAVQPEPSPIAVVAPPQTGKGLTLENAPDVPAPAPEQPAAVPNQQYLANVAQQVPHSPRGNDALVPAGGDYVVQPTAPAAYQAVLQVQMPHKVR